MQQHAEEYPAILAVHIMNGEQLMKYESLRTKLALKKFTNHLKIG